MFDVLVVQATSANEKEMRQDVPQMNNYTNKQMIVAT